MNSNTLAMLSPSDWEVLRQQMKQASYRRGETVIEQGSHRRALMIVRAGTVRVEQAQAGGRIALAQLGVGDVFGEIGFVEKVPASASIIAEDEVAVDVIDAEGLASLMASAPGFAVRFYHSLAITLAQRLRATTSRLAQAGTAEMAQVNRFRVPRTGNISARQVPVELMNGLNIFERSMLTVDQETRAGTLDAEATFARISAGCDAMIDLLERYTLSQPLVEIGYSDLLAFRDTDQLHDGVGDTVFRETFPTLMLSAMIARCYAKPRGFPDDYETIAAIYRALPEGDNRLGPGIDRWFLDRPICRSRRASRDLLETMMRDIISGNHPGTIARVTSLACGAAAELFHLCRSEGGRSVVATGIDIDAEALLAGARKAEQQGLADRMIFLKASALPVAEERISLVPQNIVYALGLCEYLDDDQMIGCLDLAFDLLADGGTLIVTNLADGHPDRALMHHLLDWKTHDRTTSGVQEIFRRSRFAERAVTIDRDETGVTLFARCVKI